MIDEYQWSSKIDIEAANLLFFMSYRYARMFPDSNACILLQW